MKCKGLGGTKTSLFVVFQGGNYYLRPHALLINLQVICEI